MQKDFHYYMTFALAIKAGIEFTSAKQIAWSNQFTDDCKDIDRYGIRTMVDITWKTLDCFVPEVQRSVFVPFHFLPGSRESLIVKADSELARNLVEVWVWPCDAVEFGIALHGYQDTFSHEGFTGVQDNHNAKHKWDLQSMIAPRIGHAEFGHDPDIISGQWMGFSGLVDNTDRFFKAALNTLTNLEIFAGNSQENTAEQRRKYLIECMDEFWRISHYESRKKWLMDWADIGDVHRYSCFEPPTEYIERFVKAAKRQQSLVFEYLS